MELSEHSWKFLHLCSSTEEIKSYRFWITLVCGNNRIFISIVNCSPYFLLPLRLRWNTLSFADVIKRKYWSSLYLCSYLSFTLLYIFLDFLCFYVFLFLRLIQDKHSLLHTFSSLCSVFLPVCVVHGECCLWMHKHCVCLLKSFFSDWMWTVWARTHWTTAAPLQL